MALELKFNVDSIKYLNDSINDKMLNTKNVIFNPKLFKYLLVKYKDNILIVKIQIIYNSFILSTFLFVLYYNIFF